MDGLDDLGLSEAEQVVVSFQVLRPVLEPLTAKGSFVQLVGLDHGPHRAVENNNAFAQQALKLPRPVYFSIYVRHLSPNSLIHSTVMAGLRRFLAPANDQTPESNGKGGGAQINNQRILI
jgi:hypothetical protein